MIEVPPHGCRRVVASPEPREVVEEMAIRALVDTNAVVITLGGGGVPVVRRDHALVGVEAVVDKDLASALLAARLRVDRLVLATDVDRVYLDYGTAAARGLDEVTADELRRHAAAGQFPPGSMGPKVEAALRFVNESDRDAVVTSYDRIGGALLGQAGTRVLPAVKG
jgi:carbamate kinase